MLTASTRERAQVLPVWIFGIFAMFVCALLRARFRRLAPSANSAQNAADAAASAAVSVQAQRFNQLEIELYALSLGVSRQTTRRRPRSGGEQMGGCFDGVGVPIVGQSTCAVTYATLRNELAKSLNRYTGEITQFARVSAALSAANTEQDARSVVASMGSPANCGHPSGGDCDFAYTIFDGGITRTFGRHNVYMDSQFIRRGGCCDGEGDADAPVNVEVVVCHEYVPLIANFFGLHTGLRRVVARGSYNNVVIDSEWFQPGYLINPLTNRPFQPAEHFSGVPSLDGLAGRNDWYGNAYSGAAWTANLATGGYTANGRSALGESDRYLQWWGPMTDHPQSNLFLTGLDQVPCK